MQAPWSCRASDADAVELGLKVALALQADNLVCDLAVFEKLDSVLIIDIAKSGSTPYFSE